MLLGRTLHETRRRSPDRIALWFGPRSWTSAGTGKVDRHALHAGVLAGSS